MFKNLLAKVKQENSMSSSQISISSLQYSIETFNKHHIPPLPITKLPPFENLPCVYYYPNVLSSKACSALVASIENIPETPKHLPYSSRNLFYFSTENFPDFATLLGQFLIDSGLSPRLPNNLLLNIYPETIGIMSHTDGPLYFPHVAVFSLLSTCVLTFKKELIGDRETIGSIIIEQGSIYIFEDYSYTNLLHGIEEGREDTVCLKLEEVNGVIELIDCTAANLKRTSYWKIIEKGWQAIKESESILPLKGNEKFNYVIIIPRQKRISLTFRYKKEKEQSDFTLKNE